MIEKYCHYLGHGLYGRHDLDLSESSNMSTTVVYELLVGTTQWYDRDPCGFSFTVSKFFVTDPISRLPTSTFYLSLKGDIL